MQITINNCCKSWDGGRIRPFKALKYYIAKCYTLTVLFLMPTHSLLEIRGNLFLCSSRSRLVCIPELTIQYFLKPSLEICQIWNFICIKKVHLFPKDFQVHWLTMKHKLLIFVQRFSAKYLKTLLLESCQTLENCCRYM